jgi:hypothetical protein
MGDFFTNSSGHPEKDPKSWKKVLREIDDFLRSDAKMRGLAGKRESLENWKRNTFSAQ